MSMAIAILERMHSERRAPILESLQVATNDAMRTSLQWRASAIGPDNMDAVAVGSTPDEACSTLSMLVYPSVSRSEKQP